MWRLAACAILLATTACQRLSEPVPPARTAIMLSASDPRADSQLLNGFYPLFLDHRWTQGRFSARLMPPKDAARKGAVLVAVFGIADAAIQNLHSIELTPTVEGVALPPERYTKAGDFTYAHDVPAGALTKEAVVVTFTLDKTLPPSGNEHRELGVNLSMLGFEAK